MLLHFAFIFLSSFSSGIPGTSSTSSSALISSADTCSICIPAVLNLADDSDSRFYPGGKDLIWYKMKVYSRWGNMVFAGEENQPWDGKIKNKGPAPAGVYVYEIMVMDRQGKKQEKTGTVTLIR
jgi:hypothetical protein